MTESSTIEAPTLSQDTLDRLAELRRQRRAITHEIKEILGSVIEDIAARPTVECLRCGFVWTPHSPAIRPRACARCVTTAWDKPPTATSRKPSDPPSPSWRVRTGERRPRMQPERKRIRYRRTREQVELDRAQAASNSAPAPLVAPQMFVPPRISALLPPPPTPNLAPPTSQTPPSLSEWLRDATAEDRSEPQPERVSSHAAPPEPPSPPSYEEIQSAYKEVQADEPNIVITKTPEHAEALREMYEESSTEVPPEQVGQPVTDAEREELERARFEVWPTTRGDDD